MFMTLAPYALYVGYPELRLAIAAAKEGGFEGLDYSIRDVAGLVSSNGALYVRDMFSAANVRPSSWLLPPSWRKGEEEWRTVLADLPRLAKASAAIDGGRVVTWIDPGANDRDYEANWAWHRERLTPIADILHSEGCRLGVEFLGPATLRATYKHPFVHTLGELMKLAKEIGHGTGVLLDSWHLYTSHGQISEIGTLAPEQIVHVHVNDAPQGVAIDAQIDDCRELPGETGVIDIVGFLRALADVGYEGFVVPEPFKAELRGLPDHRARVARGAEAMRNVFDRAGLLARRES